MYLLEIFSSLQLGSIYNCKNNFSHKYNILFATEYNFPLLHGECFALYFLFNAFQYCISYNTFILNKILNTIAASVKLPSHLWFMLIFQHVIRRWGWGLQVADPLGFSTWISWNFPCYLLPDTFLLFFLAMTQVPSFCLPCFNPQLAA